MSPRSRVTFWLLVAATVAVNAVAVVWTYASSLQRSEGFYFGLACSQISVVTIWACFADTNRFWRWLAPILFTLAAVLLTTWLYSSPSPPPRDRFGMGLAYLGLWATQVAVLTVGLWLLRQTSFGQRFQRQGAEARWQFSLMHLLIAMTTMAILIAIVRQAKIIHEVWIPVLLMLINNVLLAITTVIIRGMRWRSLLRLAATASVAGALEFALGIIGLRDPYSLAINLIQAAVLFLWLEWGGIIPQLQFDASNETPPITRIPTTE